MGLIGKIGFSLAASIVCAGVVSAHDFWLQPDRFRIESGETVALSILIGEPGSVEPWALEWRKVAAFQDFAPDHMFDLQAELDPLEGRQAQIGRADARFDLRMPGTHMVAFASNHAENDLAAPEFNEYLAHEGLAVVIADRRAKQTEGARGRELYSRRAKVLVQVGPTPTDSVSRPIGQTLELVPDRNPLLLGADEPLMVRVLFRGKALGGASVVLESLAEDAIKTRPRITDAEGRVVFPPPPGKGWSGPHKLNVVWSVPIVDPRADYETVFASLTFGK